MHAEYREFLTEQAHWKAVTRSRYEFWLLRFESFLQARQLSWQQVRRQDVQDFQQQLLWMSNGTGGLQSSNTIYQGLRLLRAFCGWAHERGLIQANPMQGWILARPPESTRPPLTWSQTLELFALPDLGKPKGHRDLVLLHLAYHGLSLPQCQELRVDSPIPADDILQRVRDRYLGWALPRLTGSKEHGFLLVTNAGEPYRSPDGLRKRLHRYRPNLTPRLLQQSRRAHQGEIHQRIEILGR